MSSPQDQRRDARHSVNPSLLFPFMIRKISIAVFIVLLVLGGLAGVKALQIKKLIAGGKSFVVPPETVSSAVARE